MDRLNWFIKIPFPWRLARVQAMIALVKLAGDTADTQWMPARPKQGIGKPIMPHEVGLRLGATWRKTDFQVHTPRDAQWNGPSFDGSEQGKIDRLAWATGLIRAAVAGGLHSIAITDHHDLEYIPVVKQALIDLQNLGEALDFWVFPGMEVTCNDNVQCLLLFDADLGLAELDRLYGGLLQNVVRPDPYISRTPQNSVCGHDISSFLSILKEDIVLKERFILLPHGGDPGSSHKSILQNGFHTRFRELDCDGVYIEKPIIALNDKTTKKIRGDFTDWGSRRRGIIPTGDNRKADFSDLGSNPCWIRLGEPTAESIRQALLADEARIYYGLPILPSHRVLRLEVSSTICGPDFKMLLNDGFNALIGGRGSGKSAALEYLRFGIGRSVFEHAGAPEEGDRVKKLLTDTLQDGFVRVTLVRGEITETWTRTVAKLNKIVVSRADASTEEITIEVAQQRFPARGYHQKELSSVVATTRSAADQITGIAAAELVAERRTNDADRVAAILELTTAFQQVVEHWSAQAAHERKISAVADLKRQIAAIQERLKAAGLSEDAQRTLALAPEYTRAAAYTRNVIDGIDRSKRALQEIASDVFGNSPEPSLPTNEDFDAVRQIIADVRRDAAHIQDLTARSVAIIDALIASVTEQQNLFAQRQGTFQEQLAVAVAEQQQHKTLLDEARLLNTRLEAAEKEEQRAAIRLKELDAAPAQYSKAESGLTELVQVRRRLLTRAAEQASAMSDGLLRASVVPTAVSDDQIKALCAMIEGSRIRSPEEKVRQYLSSVVFQPSGWEILRDRLILLCKAKARLPAIAGESPSFDDSVKQKLNEAFSFEELTDFGRQSIWTKISPATVTPVLTAMPDAYVEFEFRDHDGTYIPFERASPGQQAAALLTLLLKQKAGTLLIDQPEDDLDNRVIMQMAQLLRTTKANRQLIFSTHNPNFVVNGDADKVVVMNSGSTAGLVGATVRPRISIATDGAIEAADVRDAITEIMEGGKAAFELRGRKYDFGKVDRFSGPVKTNGRS
jgi:chromosome segregation protein